MKFIRFLIFWNFLVIFLDLWAFLWIFVWLNRDFVWFLFFNRFDRTRYCSSGPVESDFGRTASAPAAATRTRRRSTPPRPAVDRPSQVGSVAFAGAVGFESDRSNPNKNQQKPDLINQKFIEMPTNREKSPKNSRKSRILWTSQEKLKNRKN